MAQNILIIHGPNLNMLGTREPEIYGSETLDIINSQCSDLASQLSISVTAMQSNSETEIIEAIQAAQQSYDGIIINPAAYTHTSVAIRDALSLCTLPKIEVHLSNIYTRESFRHESMTAPACTAQIAGLKGQGYLLALRAISTL